MTKKKLNLIPYIAKHGKATLMPYVNSEGPDVCLFVLRFYGPVNPVGSCRARSVYLTTLLLGILSHSKRLTCIVHILSPETDKCLPESADGRE